MAALRLESLVHPAPHDRARLLDLWVAAWTPVMPDIDFASRRPWFDGHLSALIDGGAVVLVARADDETMLGFATLHPGTGELDQLAVDPRHGRSGVGTALIDEAKRRAPGRLLLSVNVANPRAVAFYRRNGFVTVGDGVNARSGLPLWRMAWEAGRPCR